MNEYIKQLEERIVRLEEQVSKRAYNQIQNPLDEISKTVLNQTVGIPTVGTGTFGTQSVAVSSTPTNINVPAQPSGTIKVLINGAVVELLKK